MRGGLNKMAEMVKRKLARKRGEEVQVMLRVSGETRRRANALRGFAVKVTLRPTTESEVVRLAIARGLLQIESNWWRLTAPDADCDWADAAAMPGPLEQIGVRLDQSALRRAESLLATQKREAKGTRSDVLRAALLFGLASLELERSTDRG